MSIRSAQNNQSNIAAIDLLGSESSAFVPIQFTNVEGSLIYLASQYLLLLHEQAKAVNSSGFMIDSITVTDLKKADGNLSIGILAPDYASYVDEGVDGWAQSRSSKFKFKTKGVDPQGAMVGSIKDWLIRENKITLNTAKPITAREHKRSKITDAATKQAVSVAFMIKRMGIKPTMFWSKATKEFEQLLEAEMGAALELDIIKSIELNLN